MTMSMSGEFDHSSAAREAKIQVEKIQVDE